MTITTISSATAAAQTQAAQGTHQHRHGHGHGMPPEATDAAASALGMSSDDLKTALKGGQTLADIAKAKGVDEKDVVSAVAGALKANAPKGAQAVSDDQLTAFATNLVEGKRPSGPPPGGMPPAGGASGASTGFDSGRLDVQA